VQAIQIRGGTTVFSPWLRNPWVFAAVGVIAALTGLAMTVSPIFGGLLFVVLAVIGVVIGILVGPGRV